MLGFVDDPIEELPSLEVFIFENNSGDETLKLLEGRAARPRLQA